MSSSPRLIQTYLTDGTLEGIRVVDPEGDIEAYIIPRLKLSEVRREEKLNQPALYILLNAEDNRAYIGESENFLARAGQHLKSKDWWTLAVAIVHKTNSLNKGDVKYLESLAVERARGGSVSIENGTIPPRNNIHRFQVHKLDRILDDTQLVLTSLGYDVLSQPEQKQQQDQIWYCKSKLTDAKAVFRADQFVVLSGSLIDKSHTASFEKNYLYQVTERQSIFAKSIDHGGYVELVDNVAFKSPNHAGHIVTGRAVNAWTTWKNSVGQTMDEVMRRGE